MNIMEIVMAGVVPAAATTLVAALGVAINDRRQQRSTAMRYRQTIADGTQLLGFVREWMATQQQVIDPEEVQQLKAEVRQTTERIYREVERAERVHLAAEEERQYKKEISIGAFFRDLLLLGTVPSSPLRRVAKGLYQVVIGFSLFSVISTVISLVLYSAPGEGGVGVILFAVFSFVAVAVLPLIFFRRLALGSPRAANGHRPSSPATVATSEESQTTSQP